MAEGYTPPSATDLARMRRFAFTTGLALLTYVIAGVSIPAPASVSAFGLRVQIQQPGLLPIALALAALYASMRYYYYALMLADGPFRRRRNLLDGLVFEGPPIKVGPFPSAGTYFGPSKLSTTPSYHDHKIVAEQAEMLRKAFPKFLGGRVKAKPEYSETTDDEGNTEPIWSVACEIPARCRLACLLEDLDYVLPIVVNIFPLCWYVARYFGAPI